MQTAGDSHRSFVESDGADSVVGWRGPAVVAFTVPVG